MPVLVFDAVAVKVTVLPLQVGLLPAVCARLTEGVRFGFTVGNVAVLLAAGVNEQPGVTSVLERPVMVIVCPLFAVVNAIVLNVATPKAFEVAVAVCVSAVPPMV